MTVSTRKQTITKQQAKVALSTESLPNKTGLQTLTPEEEKVIRMRYGLGEPDETWLEFGVGANHETMLNLALVETHNIVQLDGQVPVCGGEHTTSAREAIARLMDRYGQQD